MSKRNIQLNKHEDKISVQEFTNKGPQEIHEL